MELRNLLSFMQVAELGGFTKAAEALGYSQSTISFQIKQLEAELDCLLFERINHIVTLTDKGRALLEYAHSVNQLTEEFMQSIKSQNEPSGLIHFVAPDSVCEDMLLKNYRLFHEKYPKINLKFTNADTRMMFSMLDKNEADAVFTLDYHNYQRNYVIAKEEPVRMNFVTSVRSPLAGKRGLTLAELADCPFILTEKNIGYRRNFDTALARKSMEIIPVLEIGRTDIILSLLEETDMISYLPEFITEKKFSEGKLTYLDVTDVEPTVWKQLIYRKNKWISNCMRAFLDFVEEHEFGGASGVDKKQDLE